MRWRDVGLVEEHGRRYVGVLVSVLSAAANAAHAIGARSRRATDGHVMDVSIRTRRPHVDGLSKRELLHVVGRRQGKSNWEKGGLGWVTGHGEGWEVMGGAERGGGAEARPGP